MQIVDIPEVTEQIDGMVKDLKKEKADDIKQKDYCVEELNNNERPHYMTESAAVSMLDQESTWLRWR